MGKWKFAGAGTEGRPFNIGGVNVWDFKWVLVSDRRIEVVHESDPKPPRPTTCVYKIIDKEREIVFAADEFTPGIYGFYVSHTDTTDGD